MIVRTRNQGNIEVRSFALTDMLRYGYQGLRSYNLLAFNEDNAKGIPALNRAARLRSEALASLRLYCYSGDGPERARRDNVWQSQLFKRDSQNEFQTRFEFWATIGESLAWRNNAYIWKNVDPLFGQPRFSGGRVVDWWALHPDQVQVTGPGRYRVKIEKGYVDPVGLGKAVYEVDTSTILHIRGYGNGGTLEAPTPIQVFREALAGPVLRQRHEAKMWSKGASLQLAIEFPPGVKPNEAEQWKESWRRTYEGASGDTTAVVGGGAKITPIGMTTADAKYVEMAHLTTDDAARIMGVPANLLGSASAGKSGLIPKLEQDLAAWLRFGLGPELERIESALAADKELFGGAQTYPKFDTDHFVRGDLATEAAILTQLVQVGILTPNEARASLGRDELPDDFEVLAPGDTPQITPVGGAPNPAMMQMPPAAEGEHSQPPH